LGDEKNPIKYLAPVLAMAWRQGQHTVDWRHQLDYPVPLSDAANAVDNAQSRKGSAPHSVNS
jgi:hypothetical protein